VENISEIIYSLDAKGVFMYVNPAIESILGYAPSEMIGRSFADFLHEPDLPRQLERFNRVVSGPIGSDEYRLVNKSGEIRWVRSTTRPVFSGNRLVRLEGVAIDITERKCVEEELRNSEQRLTDIINFLPDATFVIDNEGKVISWNYAMEEMTGIKAEDMLGKGDYEYAIPFYGERRPVMIDLVGQWDDETAKEYEYVKKEGEILVSETRNPSLRPDDTLFWNAARLLYNAEGEKIGAIETIRDITYRMRIEEELKRHRDHLGDLVKERTQDLEQAQAELLKRERLSVLGQLTATVSHELRNPLGVISSSAFFLKKKVQQKDLRIAKHLERIEEQVGLCDSIVEDLLEYTRGRAPAQVTQELNPWLENVVDRMVESEAVELEKELSPDLPRISFDPEKMERVVVNLINNALQAVSARQEKCIERGEVYGPVVKVMTRQWKGRICLEVTDNGMGMDRKTAEKAFEPLFTTRARGTGLGLANVMKIVAEHGGEVFLESRPGEGTTVAVMLVTEGGRSNG
jgi:PAS domain S-box-containing protein